jgi:AAA15 family ATPase/GTPase
MIDEIDAGIHYSRFELVWQSVLRAAITNHVQLFITTHNVECLKALQAVLHKNSDLAKLQSQCCAFTLQKLPDDSVKAYKHSFSQFENAMTKGYELRGGVL